MKVSYCDPCSQNNIYRPSFGIVFSELEKSVMKEMIEYSKEHGVETMRILKNGKNITGKFKIIEEEKRCEPLIKEGSKVFGINLGRFGKYINKIRYFRNTVQFHTHPKELPLGPADIWSAIDVKMEKSIAVTPTGRYSAITIPKSQRRKAKKGMKIFEEWAKYMEQYKGKSKEEIFPIVQRTLTEALNKFAKQTGTKYESDIEVL